MRALFALLALGGSVMTRCENDTHTFNVDPPTRLDIIMVPDSDWVGRCDRMGGEPIYYPADAFPDRDDLTRWVCEGVDY
jgi:hypothetical protein